MDWLTTDRQQKTLKSKPVIYTRIYQCRHGCPATLFAHRILACVNMEGDVVVGEGATTPTDHCRGTLEQDTGH